jgi:hypothetical protein
MAYKTWAIGDVIAAADLNTVSTQSVSVFTTTTSRTSSIGTPALGQPTYIDDYNRAEIWDGAVWQPLPAAMSVFTATGTATVAAGGSALISIVLPYPSRFQVAPIVAGLTTNALYVRPVVNAVAISGGTTTVTVAMVNNTASSQASGYAVYGVAIAMTAGTAVG